MKVQIPEMYRVIVGSASPLATLAFDRLINATVARSRSFGDATICCRFAFVRCLNLDMPPNGRKNNRRFGGRTA